MPGIVGILETSLYVAEPEAAANFYQRLFGFKTLTSDDRLSALSISQRQVLLLFRKDATPALPTAGGTIPPHGGSGNLHLAFAIADAEYDAWKHWLKQNSIAIESEVTWLRGGRSLYFRDPDGHLLELVTPRTWTIY
jgi:catechol 2,3-dioxygenase-like lactoylglutathione lyase family enzyme